MGYCNLSLKNLLVVAWNILRDAPKYAAWIEQFEIAHRPRLIHWLAEFHIEALGDSLFRQMRMPIVNVFNEQMHHEILRVLDDVEILQEKTTFADVKVRNLIICERAGKSDRLIKRF